MKTLLVIVISKQHQQNVLIRYTAHRLAQILSFIFETKTPIIYYVPIQREKNALSIGKYFVNTVIISIGTATSKLQPFFKMYIIRNLFDCYCYVLLHSLIFFYLLIYFFLICCRLYLFVQVILLSKHAFWLFAIWSNAIWIFRFGLVYYCVINGHEWSNGPLMFNVRYPRSFR